MRSSESHGNSGRILRPRCCAEIEQARIALLLKLGLKSTRSSERQPVHELLRAALNAGNRRGGRITRCVPPKMDLADFSVFRPKAMAGINSGNLPDTIKDRSILIDMKRRRAGEMVERLRHRDECRKPSPSRMLEWLGPR